MITVVFQVQIKPGLMDKYLAIAKSLVPELHEIEGFVSSERFTSINDENKLLSYSVWESEEALNEWRNIANHRLAQTKGRTEIFDDYQITVSSPIRDYTLTKRDEAPEDSNEFFDIEI